VNGAIVQSSSASYEKAEEALSELGRRNIPLVLVTPRTRAEIEPVRRKIGHIHPFITESGGGIFFPDGYFNVRISGAVRNGRYLCISQGRPYAEVCEALDDIAEKCHVGVAGFHHMSAREIADNAGLRPRDAEVARSREYDEPFFFTSADEPAIAIFLKAAEEAGYQARKGHPFWHFSAGCDPARAVRTVTKLFRDTMRTKLRSVGISADPDDAPWLRAMDQAILLPERSAPLESAKASAPKGVSRGAAPGPAGWNEAIMNIIS
jgi:mannosyl-3-phosphoglycerate phosphatase family protein